MTLGNKNISLIVRQFGEYFGVNCGFLATSMKFSSMIEFDLVKKISLGATWKKIQYGHQFQDGHHYIRIFSWITVQLVCFGLQPWAVMYFMWEEELYHGESIDSLKSKMATIFKMATPLTIFWCIAVFLLFFVS